MTSYDRDYYKWTNEQAVFLFNKDFDNLDIINLIQEIESLGRSEKNSLRSFLINLFKHELKTKYQPEKQTNSWKNSIFNSKKEIIYILEENPSLKSKFQEVCKNAYKRARSNASFETGLDVETFPEECPWDINELLNDEGEK